MYFKPAVATSLGQALYPCAISDEVCPKYASQPPNFNLNTEEEKNVFLLLLCLAGQSEPHFKKLWGPEKKLHSILKTIKKMYAFHCISCTVKLHTIKA